MPISPRNLPTPPSNLRPRQVEAFNAIFDHLSRGITKQLCMLPTGVGKTYLFVAVAQQFKRALFLVPRIELLHQAAESYANVNDGQRPGVVWGSTTDVSNHCTVAMVPTMYNRMTDLPRDYFDLICFDECVHGDARLTTDVGKVMMRDLPASGATRVLSWDGGRVVWRRILSWTPSGVKPTVEVRTRTGRTITCTHDHPVYTPRGWVEAGNLGRGDTLLATGADTPRSAEWTAVEGVRSGRVADVYDIGVEETHCFFANDLLVHNCHHAMATQWKGVAEYFTPALRLGLSATPERLDGAPLSDIFDVISYSMTVRDAVKEGALTRPKAIQVQTNVRLDSVKKTAGDFSKSELQRALNVDARNQIILDTFKKHAQDRKTVGFTSGVEHARELERIFNNAGISSISVAGEDKDRSERVKAFEDGQYQVIWNASLLTEGWDDPTVECVMMCRPTQSKALYMQAVGRGLRLHAGKDDCLIIDFSDSSRRHRLVGVWDFWGSKVKRKLEEPQDLEEAEEKAERDLDELRGLFDVEVYLEHIDVLEPPPDIDEYVLGAYKWHHMPATEKQIALLSKLGHDVENTEWNRGQASAVIGREPPSTAQMKLLLALGFDTIGQKWTRNQASAAIDQAKEQGRTPDWGNFKKFMKPREKNVGWG